MNGDFAIRVEDVDGLEDLHVDILNEGLDRLVEGLMVFEGDCTEV